MPAADFIRMPTADSLYAAALRYVLEHGERTSPRGLETREVRGLTLRLEQSANNVVTYPARRLNYPFMVGEWLWVACGRADVASLAALNPRLREFSDDGVSFYGAYGPQWVNQVHFVLERLEQDAATRQAVLLIWRPRPPAHTRDVPCTISLQFQLRRDALHLHACMRSNDLWLGLPYDLFTFTMLQNLLAGKLGVARGDYTHSVGNAHLYHADIPGAERLLEAPAACLPTSTPDVSWPIPRVLAENLAALCTGERQQLEGLPEVWRGYAAVIASRHARETPPELPTWIAPLRANRIGVWLKRQEVQG